MFGQARPEWGGATMSLLARLMTAFLVLLASIATVSDGWGHPHVWIDTVATFVFDRGKIVAVRVEWTFDEFFTDFLLGKYDTNKDRKFDENEVKRIQEEAFSSLKELNYFTHIYIANKKLGLREVSEFSADYHKGKAVYRFTVPLPSPADPMTVPVDLSVYDESFYVDVRFDQAEPIRFHGAAGSPCRYWMHEDKNNPIYFGMVNPQRVQLQCKRA
jgi:ABC-type uncharacterized transport system substrate-binding protein